VNRQERIPLTAGLSPIPLIVSDDLKCANRECPGIPIARSNSNRLFSPIAFSLSRTLRFRTGSIRRATTAGSSSRITTLLTDWTREVGTS
jgi:hypothetical protein